MYAYCEIFTWGIPQYGDEVYIALNSQLFKLCVEFSVVQVGMYDVVERVLFSYQNLCITLKIQLLRLKSDFVT